MALKIIKSYKPSPVAKEKLAPRKIIHPLCEKDVN